MSLLYPYRRPASRVGGAGDGDDCSGSNSLGPRMEALVGQLIRAMRLATLALVATKTTALIEPRVERIGAAVGRVHERLDVTGEEARAAAAEIATASTKILGRARARSGLRSHLLLELRRADATPGARPIDANRCSLCGT